MSTLSRKSLSRLSSKKNARKERNQSDEVFSPSGLERRSSSTSKRRVSKVSKRQKHGIQFELWLHLTDIPKEYEGKNLFISWQRGKGNEGVTPISTVTNGSIRWEDSIVLSSWMQYDREGEHYVEKNLYFKLKDEKQKVVSRCEVDLSKYAALHFSESKDLDSEDFKKTSTKLKFEIEPKLLQVDNKRIVGVLKNPTQSQLEDENTIMLGGLAYATQIVTEVNNFEGSEEEANQEAGLVTDGPVESPRSFQVFFAKTQTLLNSLNKRIADKDEELKIKNARIEELEKEVQKMKRTKSSIFKNSKPPQAAEPLESEKKLNEYKEQMEDLKKRLEDAKAKKDRYKIKLRLYQSNQQPVDTENMLPTISSPEIAKPPPKKESNTPRDQEVKGDGNPFGTSGNPFGTPGNPFGTPGNPFASPQQDGNPFASPTSARKARAAKSPNAKLDEKKVLANISNSPMRSGVGKNGEGSLSSSARPVLFAPDVSNPFDNSSVEIAVEMNIAKLIYQNEMVMGEHKGYVVTQASLDLFNWIENDYDNIFSINETYYEKLLKAIESLSIKTESPIILDVSVHWLSTMCTLIGLLEDTQKEKYNNFKQQSQILFYKIYEAIVNHFLKIACPHLIEVFTKVQSSKSKRKCPTFNRWRQPPPSSKDPSLFAGFNWELSDVLSFLSDYLLSFWRFALGTTLVQDIFSSLMSSVNRFMFNQLLSNEGLCTAANGFQIKLTLSLLMQWLTQKDVVNWTSKSEETLQILAEGATLLTIDKQLILTDPNMLSLVCPSVSPPQREHLIANSRSDTTFGQSSSSTAVRDWFRFVMGTGANAEILLQPEAIDKAQAFPAYVVWN
eukprot:TRINITY_DN3432_c0_g1_i1.p1 TRINITY_DN3432_c0_g1~~TRINITY_DN3432_c0_g1_i1.p1  ORF type:complete len:841 (+),score=195.18 TRINITY_DN3432_c0_g1_i1:151-2673(+)